MKGIRFAEGMKILPLVAPVAFTTSAITSKYIDLDNINWATFILEFGVMTSDSTDTMTVTVLASTSGDSTDTGTAIAFNYRLSSAVDTDSMGAITAATVAGVAVTATDDAKVLIVDVDPAALPAALTDAKYLHLVATPNAEHGGGVISMVAICESRYPGNAIPSST